MARQLCFEDVRVGDSVPPLEKTPTLDNLIRYCAAIDYFYPSHFDQQFARRAGFPDVLVHGVLKSGFMGQMMMDWAGPKAWIRKMDVQYRRPDFPGRRLTCKGRVLRTYIQDGRGLVDLDIWVENEAGERTTPGTVTIQLPRKTEETPQ